MLTGFLKGMISENVEGPCVRRFFHVRLRGAVGRHPMLGLMKYCHSIRIVGNEKLCLTLAEF
jgi:hypothetical protein